MNFWHMKSSLGMLNAMYYNLKITSRPPDKIAYWKTLKSNLNFTFKNKFFISHPKHMLWVLKRTLSMKRFF